MNGGEVVPRTGGQMLQRKPAGMVPLGQRPSRLPEQGRIRTGVKKKSQGGKEYPSKLDTFRFTSHDEAAIRALAEKHGGTPQPWKDAPTAGQWEVITKASAISVALTADPLTQWYELWGAAGCTRRCDGLTLPQPRQTPDGVELVDAPCICNAYFEEHGTLPPEREACKPTTRLTVVVRDAPFGGGWRLESHGYIAATELRDMVAMIQGLEGGQPGLLPAVLLLKEFKKPVQVRHKQCQGRGCADCSNGQITETRRWLVPSLRVDATVDQILSGEARLGALASGRQVPIEAAAKLAIDAPIEARPVDVDAESRALEAGVPDTDEDIADGELVGDDGSDPGEVTGEPSSSTQDPTGGEEAEPGTDSSSPATGAAGSADSLTKMRSKLHAMIGDLHKATGVEVDVLRHGLAKRISGQESSNGLDPEQLAMALDLLDDIGQGRRKFMGVDGLGVMRISGLAEES